MKPNKNYDPEKLNVTIGDLKIKGYSIEENHIHIDYKLEDLKKECTDLKEEFLNTFIVPILKVINKTLLFCTKFLSSINQNRKSKNENNAKR